jgi:uncharacterized membrane protein YkoI
LRHTNFVISIIAGCFLTLLSTSLCASFSQAFAQAHLRAPQQLSLEQAVQMAESRYGARVVRADVNHFGKQRVYFLRLLNREGRVWTVRINASDGTIR